MLNYLAKKNLPFKEVGYTEFPQEVQIQLNTQCNARCVMCPYQHVYKNISHGRMNDELFKQIIDECAYHEVKDLKPFLMNEPLIDRRLPRLIGYARTRLPNTNIGFSTNGELLEGEISDELLECGLNELWINFSGNTKATYESVMKGLNYERVRKNIIDFARKAANNNSKLKIFLSMVELKPNLSEINDSVSYWKDYGITVATVPFNNRGGNIDVDEMQVLKEIKDYRVCDKPFYKISILYNGDVILCPSDWNRTVVIGNIKKDGIYRVWHSELRKSICDLIANRHFEKLHLCKNCDFIAIYD